MRRREFVAGLAGALAWPRAARAQQPERMRRIGLLLGVPADDSEYATLVSAFLQELQKRGWSDGRNIRIDIRWGSGGATLVRENAAELLALGPDVVIAPGSSPAAMLLQATRSVPVVFTIVPDPVGAGLVDSLARPGGNATGFASFDYGIAGKWLELLKEVAPDVKRVGVLRDSDITAGIGQLSAIQTAAPTFGLEVILINLRDAPALERSIKAFARSANGGLVVAQGPGAIRHRDLIIRLSAEHRLPALYYARSFVTGGGLISYGSDRTEQFQRAAGYVDRVLRGENPAEMPVLAPTKYEMAINRKTANALGLTIPPSLLARADEVIE